MSLGLLLSGQAEAAGFTPTKQDAKEKAYVPITGSAAKFVFVHPLNVICQHVHLPITSGLAGARSALQE